MNRTTVSLITKSIKLLAVASLFFAAGILLEQKMEFSAFFSGEAPAEILSEAGGAAETAAEEEFTAQSLSDWEKVKCEHGVGLIDCDACRYEAGVVKITPSIKPLIETALIEEVDRTKVLKLTGQIQLDRTRAVEVMSAGGGRIEQVKVLLGEKVKAGDILAVIHSADLGQVKADFLEVQARLELNQATFRREKELYEKKITSQADYLNAMNESKAAEASYAATDRRLRLFGMGTEQIAEIGNEKENGEFANLILRAPQDGTIIAQTISAGKMVDTTEALYTIADLSNVWVWCDVYEKDLAILQEQSVKDQPPGARVKVRAFESTIFNGEVDFVGHLVDEHTRTIPVRVQMKNPENKLRPGMFADVEVIIPQPGRMVAVPRAAVMSEAGKSFVFMQWKNDLWVRRDVVTGSLYGELVEILSGITAGETLVSGGAFMLKSDILRENMGAGCAD